MSNYSEDLEIDKFNLEQEWIEQSSLFFKYMQLEADAAKREAEIKEACDITLAEVEKEVRACPGEYGLKEKPPASAVMAAVNLSKDVQEAREELRDARHELAMMQAAVRAFTHRKSALENLVRLQGQGYYSSPAVSDSEAEGFNEKVRNDKQKEVRKRKPKRKPRRKAK